MFKLILNEVEKEYDILTNANDSSFTVICGTMDEALSVKDLLTVNALKLVKYKQGEGVYSIVENKEYANKYLVEELSDKCLVTYYLINHEENTLDSIITRLAAMEVANSVTSEAVVELASALGGGE